MGMVKPDTFSFAADNQSTCVEIHSQNCKFLVSYTHTHTHTQNIFYIFLTPCIYSDTTVDAAVASLSSFVRKASDQSIPCGFIRVSDFII